MKLLFALLLVVVVVVLSINKGSYCTQLKHLEYFNSLNRNSTNAKYFCTSLMRNNSSTLDYWHLRNKKCFNFSTDSLDFYQASSVCNKKPYNYARLIHRNQLEFLIKNRLDSTRGLDVFEIYHNLLFKQSKQSLAPKNASNRMNTAVMTTTKTDEKFKFSLWLDDNEFAGFACQSDKYAPIVRFDQFECRNGCYECALRRQTKAMFACVKFCEWKVPFNSYCNSNQYNQTRQINSNLFLIQNAEQIYVCQGELKCIDYNCKCPVNKKLVDEFYCNWIMSQY